MWKFKDEIPRFFRLISLGLCACLSFGGFDIGNSNAQQQAHRLELKSYIFKQSKSYRRCRLRHSTPLNVPSYHILPASISNGGHASVINHVQSL